MSGTMCDIEVDGRMKEYPVGISYLSLAREYQSNYSNDIVLAVFNNELKELNNTVKRDGRISFVTTADHNGRRTYRRSLSFLLEAAAHRAIPEMSVLIQHSIDNGYYCELTKNDELYKPDASVLELLKSEMNSMVKEDLPIEKINISINDARARCTDWGLADKEKMLRYRRTSQVNIYILSGYFDYYYGYLLPSTGYLKYFDILPYQNGFMLTFPTKDPVKLEQFKPSDKLFYTFDEAAHWGEKMGIRTVGSLNDAIAKGETQDMILVQEALMESKIADLAEKIAADPRIKFIMIAGPSSSGKTTFSHRLSIQLRAHGMMPHPISMDDFYNRKDTPLDEFGQPDFESVEALDVKLLNKVMNSLLSGKETDMPVFKLKTGMREYHGKKLKLSQQDVLVVEGIHGLNEKLSKEVPRESKFKIYISALTQLNIDHHNNLSTTDGRLLRRIVRDARTRNTSAKDTLARWDSVRRGEEKNIFPFQEQADVMFNSALIYEMSVLKLYVEPLLFEIDNDCPEYMEAKRLLKFLDYFLPVPGESIGHNSILREFIGGSCFNV